MDSETPSDDKSTSNFEPLLCASTASNTVGAMIKDGQTNGGGNYKFMSHDNVTARCKEVFAKVGIYHFATVTDMQQNGNRTTCFADLSFINVDDPSDRLVTKSVGHGVDNQDKGVGKAYSYAVKYGLNKALMLNTNEDIESGDIDYDDGNGAKVIAAKSETQEAVQAWAKTFKAAIESAPNPEAVKALEKDNRAQLSSKDLAPVTRDFFIQLIETRKQETF